MIIDNVYVRFSNGETSANVKLYTDNWAALTNDNFAMEVKVTSLGSINKSIAADGQFPTYDITPTYNYNASTGVLSVTGGYTDKGGGSGLSRSMAATVTVFLLEVE